MVRKLNPAMPHNKVRESLSFSPLKKYTANIGHKPLSRLMAVLHSKIKMAAGDCLWGSCQWFMGLLFSISLGFEAYPCFDFLGGIFCNAGDGKICCCRSRIKYIL